VARTPGAERRGGARQGQSGKTYPNRSDLNYEGQTYGQAQGQAQRQQAVPQGQAPQTVAPTPSPNAPRPGDLPPLNAPSARPDEPVTAGAELGPGAGPDALGLLGSDLLDKQDYEAWKTRLPVLIFHANHTGSPSFANWVRQLSAGA
jgi:hypothetical protein